MRTVSVFKTKTSLFEASYSIQLSYGCAMQQVCRFITETISMCNAFMRAPTSLNITVLTGFRSCELWEICGLYCFCPDCVASVLGGAR